MTANWTIAAQGEIKLRRLSDDAAATPPPGFAPLPPEGRNLVVGHSETGHHHVVDREKATAYVSSDAPEGMRILRLIVAAPTLLEHLRPHDTHAPIDLDPGEYELRIGREFDPYAELARQVAD